MLNPKNRTPRQEAHNGILSAFSATRRHTITFPENSPYTDQSYADEADINTIMAKYRATGELPQLNSMEPNFLDVTEMDFQGHMNIIVEAQNMFAQLPADLRDRFGNSPAAFLGFTSDPANLTEIAKLGLLSPDAAQKALNPTPTLDSET